MTNKPTTASHTKTLLLGFEKRLEISRRDRVYTHRRTDKLTDMVNGILNKNKSLKPKIVPVQKEIHKETDRLTELVNKVLDKNKNN